MSNFSISSNTRAEGTLLIKDAITEMGLRVSAAILKFSFAAKRTTRSMRTGSSR